MDLRRWITGGGWQSIPFPLMMILWLCEAIPFSKSLTSISSYKVKIERRYADTRCTACGMVPVCMIPSTIQSTIRRYRVVQLVAVFSCRIRSRIRSWLQQQWRYRTSLTRFVFGGAIIYIDGDDSAGIATTPTTKYRTRRAETKHRDTHSPIENGSTVEKCTQRCDGK